METKTAEENELLKRYPHLKLVDHGKGYGNSRTTGAKNIRIELKRAFPGIKFSVRTKSYSGGDSTDVSWMFGPTCKEVEAITGKYVNSSFDGMVDLKSYIHTPFLSMFGGTNYVFTSRSHKVGYTTFKDNDIHEQIGRDLCKIQKVEYKGRYTQNVFGHLDNTYLDVYVDGLLRGMSLKANEEYAGIRRVEEGEVPTSERIGCVIITRVIAGSAPTAKSPDNVPCGIKKATITRNTQLNGIELKFPNKPDEPTRITLKSMGYIWNGKKVLWWTKYTDEKLKAIEEAVKSEKSLP